MLLKSAFGGNSRTTAIVTASQDPADMEQTLQARTRAHTPQGAWRSRHTM
jgi:hypothetical protein